MIPVYVLLYTPSLSVVLINHHIWITANADRPPAAAGRAERPHKTIRSSKPIPFCTDDARILED